MFLSGALGLDKPQGIFELPYSSAHVYYFLMELFGIGKDKPGGRVNESKRDDMIADLLPFPEVREPRE